MQRFVEVLSRRQSVENDPELQGALLKMKNTEPKVQGCLACERGINASLARQHTFDCRQTVLPSLVIRQFVDVKFEADGKLLKRHGHEENDDDRDPKRVRFTHKQPVKRADSEVTDDKDTDAKRAKLCDTPSVSSSSHEIAPKLHDSSSVDESAETPESVTKKPRVDGDMERKTEIDLNIIISKNNCK